MLTILILITSLTVTWFSIKVFLVAFRFVAAKTLTLRNTIGYHGLAATIHFFSMRS